MADGMQGQGWDPGLMQNLAFALAKALDPEGFGGRFAQGGQAALQSGVLAGERGAQQQGLAQLLGLTPKEAPGPTKTTINADGSYTTTGNLPAGTGGAQPQGAATPQAQPMVQPTAQPGQAGGQAQDLASILGGAGGGVRGTMEAPTSAPAAGPPAQPPGQGLTTSPFVQARRFQDARR